MFDPGTEARSYPLIYRVIARALKEVPNYVSENEDILVTGPASSTKPRGKRQIYAPNGQYRGSTSTYNYFLVVATDLRLLVLEIFAGSTGRSYSLSYSDITRWTLSLERLMGGSPSFRKVGRLIVASPQHQLDLNRIPPKKVSTFRDVVEPRLPIPARVTQQD
jgi:hypothetical protein